MCWLYVCIVVSACCTCRLCSICVYCGASKELSAVMCWLYYACVVLDRHRVCLVLAALWLYVKWGAWHTPDARGQ